MSDFIDKIKKGKKKAVEDVMKRPVQKSYYNLTPMDRIVKARIALQHKSPFYSYLTMHLNFEKNDNTAMTGGSMGVDPDGNVYYNEEFVKRLTDEELTFLISHEVSHVAFLTHTRRKARNPLLWNISSDTLINFILQNNGFTLIPGGIIPNGNKVHIWGIPIIDIDKKSTEEIYDELYTGLKNKLQGMKGNSKNKTEGDGIPIEIDGGDYQLDEHIQERTKGNKDGCGKGNGGKEKDDNSGKNGDKISKIAKEHEQKEKGNEEGEGKDGGETGQEKENQETPEQEWTRRVAEAYAFAKSKGIAPAGIDRQVDEILHTQQNWEQILYRYITHELATDVDWSMPSRRSQAVGIYLPHMKKENLELAVWLDTSGCLTADTLIYTDDGIKSISEIKEGDRIINSDFKKNGFDTVKRKYTFKTNKLIVIRTKDGKEIKCTPNHKIFIFKNKCSPNLIGNNKFWSRSGIKSSSIIEKRADEIRKRDLLFVPKRIDCSQEEVELPNIIYNDKYSATPDEIRKVKELAFKYSAYEIAKTLKLGHQKVYNIIQNKERKRKHPVIPQFINREFAELLGYICGDGNISVSPAKYSARTTAYTQVTDKNLENLEYYKRIADKFQINSCIRTRSGRNRLCLNSKEFTYYLIENFPEIVCKSRQRTIPSLIIKSKDDVVAGFIRGFFDAEGTVADHNFIIFNTSEKIIRQIQILLNRLGIGCYIQRYMMPKRRIQNSYIKETLLFRLTIGTVRNLKSFNEIIGVTRNDKKLRIASIQDRFRRNTDRINITYNENVELQRVTNISMIDTENEDVYDLEMERNHNYFANGILVHNSIDNEQLKYFLGLLQDIVNSFQNITMYVIPCDSEMHGVFEIGHGKRDVLEEVKPKGGGGTDVQPVIKFLQEKKPNTRLLICITDGELFHRPKTDELNAKIIWLIPENGGTIEMVKGTGEILRFGC